MLNGKITQMTLIKAKRALVGGIDHGTWTVTVEDTCKGPDPAMDIELLDGVPILGGIDAAGLKVDAVCGITGAKRECQWLRGALEFPCKLCFR